MKEDIMDDVSNLLYIIQDCKQEFYYWEYFLSKDSEMSMHFNKLSNICFKTLLMDMHQTLNRSQSDKCTFWRIFSKLESKEYAENAITSMDILKWRAMLTKYDISINKIKVKRDTRIVHKDKDATEPEFVSMGELKKLLIIMELVMIEMLSKLEHPITHIPIIGEGNDLSIAEAFRLMGLAQELKQLFKKLGLDYSEFT